MHLDREEELFVQEQEEIMSLTREHFTTYAELNENASAKDEVCQCLMPII